MMIPWRATPLTRQGVDVLMVLAPVAFNPDVAAASVGPVAADPDGVGVWRFHIVSGNPDVAVAVPAVVAVVPGPAGVLVWWWRDYLNRVRWGRADSDDDLGLCDARNK
jgi:hypothetical protein